METTEQEEKAATVEISEEGVLKIKGRIFLRDLKRDISSDMEEVSLCLCGRTRNKPYCDDSHKTGTEQSR